MSGRALLAALGIGSWCVLARAEIVVNNPQPITRHVTVQLIQMALDDGGSPASVFGNATQRADIETAIDVIWAQAGIDVFFLPGLTRWNDTFAYRGDAGTGRRPGGDLSEIIDAARTEGILHDDSLVLNMFFVNVVPTFEPLDDNNAAGYARVTGNGIAVFVGTELLTWNGGREIIARVMAHEIGHNLGLNHMGSGQPNLMNPRGTTEQLNVSQISMARASRFARLIAVQLAGDFNRDGSVDAADYTVWRNTLGDRGGSLAADGDGDGIVDQDDYTIWRRNYGGRSSLGTGALADIPNLGLTAVPEANTIPGVATIVAVTAIMLRKRNS